MDREGKGAPACSLRSAMAARWESSGTYVIACDACTPAGRYILLRSPCFYFILRLERERKKLLTLYVFKLLLIRQHYRKQTNFQWHEIKLPKIITFLTVK
jgi:hypothetical protein